mgnify:CR=1 FL=1
MKALCKASSKRWDIKMVIVLIISLYSVLLNGCSLDVFGLSEDEGVDKNGQSNSSTTLVGTWEWSYTDIGMGDLSTPATSTVTPDGISSLYMRRQFRSNETYTETTRDNNDTLLDTFEGTYRIEGDNITFNPGSDFPITYSWENDNGTLIFTFANQDGQDVYWIRQYWVMQ